MITQNITSKIDMKVTWYSKQIIAYQTIGVCEYQSKLGEVDRILQQSKTYLRGVNDGTIWYRI